MQIRTERLLLRPFTEADAEGLYAYSKDPEVGPNAGWKPHESLEESRGILQTVFLNREAVWAILLKGREAALIGSIGLVEDDKRAVSGVRMIGYAIGREYWGKGYMTEAVRGVLDYGFSRMKLNLISGYCYPDNARSRHVMEKCGFQYEGRLRRAEALYDGRILDHLCFSIAKE